MRRKGLGRLVERSILAACVAGAVVFAIPALTQEAPRLTGQTPPMAEVAAPPVPKWVTDDVRKMRAYPEQPPVIPHTTDGYQIDINGNKCLSCHARARTGESQAPMVSITHFMDRDGQFLASVSPRRFFCTECHVPQNVVKPPVDNDFIDIDSMLSRAAPGGRR